MRKQIAPILLSFGLWAGAALAVCAEPVRLTALGDSLVQGYGLPQGEGFVPQLERWLAARGVEAQVANAGVSGDTTAGGAARIDWTLADQPDALIVLLGGNDILRGLPPEMVRANLSQILTTAKGRDVPVLLIGMQAPQNFGADYKQAFDVIYADLAAEFGAVLHENAFAGMIAQTGGHLGGQGAAAGMMQSDGIHPNRDGVAANIKALGPKVLELIEKTKSNP